MKTFVIGLLFATFAVCNVKCGGKLFSLTLYDLQKVQFKDIVLEWLFFGNM